MEPRLTPTPPNSAPPVADLRAAAERLRAAFNSKAGCPWEYVPSYSAGSDRPSPRLQYTMDCETLARVHLAANPADDDEPLTNEWVSSLLTVIPGRGAVINHVLSLFNSRHGWLVKAHAQGETDHDEAFVVVILETRGDLRRLAAALGIPLKESP